MLGTSWDPESHPVDNDGYYRGVALATEPAATHELSTTADLTERLLHAAAEVFGDKGYEKARVAEIARRAGVTTGAIYSRYSGKADLLLDAVDHHVPRELTALLSGSGKSDSAVDVLSQLGAHLVDQLDEGAGLLLEAVVAARRDPDLAERLRRRVEDEDARLGKLVDEATADGLFDSDLDRLAIVRVAHAIGFGMLLTRSMGLDLPSADSWTAVIDRVIGAAGPKETNTPSNGDTQ